MRRKIIFPLNNNKLAMTVLNPKYRPKFRNVEPANWSNAWMTLITIIRMSQVFLMTMLLSINFQKTAENSNRC